MSIRLESQVGHVTLSNADWYKAVQLAYQHGFRPPRQHPTLFKCEPFTLAPNTVVAFHAALNRALPEISDEPDPLYQLFERELLGSDIPTVEAQLHFAGKRPLLRRILSVLQGEVSITADVVMP